MFILEQPSAMPPRQRVRKSHTISMTDQEWLTLQEAALALHISVSRYILQRLNMIGGHNDGQ